MDTDLLQRFFDKVEVTDHHWLWKGSKSNGYGHFWDGRQIVGAHVFAYGLSNGPVPKGKQLDHLCRIKHCVAPDCLEAVTPRDNQLRGKNGVLRLLRAPAVLKTHCPQGHQYVSDNVYINPRGRRVCRECHRAKAAVARSLQHRGSLVSGC